MKSNYKFYLGLSFGLLIGFIAFNIENATSENTNTNQISNINGDVNVSGYWVNSSEIQPKIDAYKKFIMEKNLPENTSTGGFIKRSVLNDITGSMDGSYIKYSFFYEGEGKIGLYFQKESKPDKGIRSGSDAFCPNLCNYPAD